MTYIETYKEGNKFYGIYLCKQKQILKTKAGKTYYSLILQDKTGVIDAKVWELNNGIEDFEAMDFIMTEGMITMFQGSRQVNVSRIRRAQEGEYDPAEYIPASKYDREEMYQELKGFVESIQEIHLKQLAEKYFVKDVDFINEFKIHSAAKSVHHGFVGGLLQHPLSVMKLCDFFAKNYPIIDRDLLLTAALFHDIGKMWEISEFPANEYTDAGQLLGHIVIGVQMVHDAVRKTDGFPETLAYELEHCIVAHHGELEYGSPKKPAMAEAMALYFADNLDAKMETFKEAFAGIPENNLEWQGFNRLLDSNIRRTGRD